MFDATQKVTPEVVDELLKLKGYSPFVIAKDTYVIYSHHECYASIKVFAPDDDGHIYLEVCGVLPETFIEITSKPFSFGNLTRWGYVQLLVSRIHRACELYVNDTGRQ